MKRIDKSEIVFKLLAYILLTIFALCCLYPFIFIVMNSISFKDFVDDGKVNVIPMGFQLNAYVDVFQNKQFWLAYCNAFYTTIDGTAICMLVGICGACALSKTRLNFGRGFNFLLTVTLWFSAGTIPTYQNYVVFRDGLLSGNGRVFFIFALGVNAFNIILLRNYFQCVPQEIEEAATIDGAIEFQILTRVYIPISKSSIVTVAMFYAVEFWNGYLWAQMLLSENDLPLTPFIKLYLDKSIANIEESGGGKLSYSTYSLRYAFIVCSIVPVILIYPKIQKYFASGVNVGGVEE
jgi:putative aldouronate transport system permease protein